MDLSLKKVKHLVVPVECVRQEELIRRLYHMQLSQVVEVIDRVLAIIASSSS